ncbi:MAG: DUF3256 family protein [Bacteroidaceae bacterium]|nr:DUF3256 family protein [Bacteroidaceae bacterium]MBR5891331.1 DUF3256 family protein [Bacteroidaceae bacterium]
MRKFIYIFTLLLVAATAELAAQNMRTLFVGMPDTIFPLLTATNRADCVDFVDAGMRARVSNRLDGKSELLRLTDDFLEMKMSNHSTLQMKLLPRSAGDTIVCMVKTVCAESCDSRILFYTKDWKQLPQQFAYPPIKDFFVAADSLDTVLTIADIYLVKLNLSSSDASMVAEYTMPSYMSSGDSLFVARRARNLIYKWDGKQFKR